MRVADHGIADLQKVVDTLLIIPNQNLFRVANEKTTFADAFAMADQVLYSGVACITDLMVKEGLINLDFADVRAVMREMGKAMMGTGEAAGEKRALTAAEAAIANPLIDDSSMKGAKGLLVSITGGKDLTLYEVDEAATRIREEVDQDANIIVGATFDETLDGIIRVSVVATGIDKVPLSQPEPARDARAAETIQRKYDQPRAAGAFAPAAAPVPSMAAPTQNDVEHAAMAAVSAAIMPAAASGEDVTIRPLARSKPSLLLDGAGQPQDQSLPQAFIPPAPESVANRPRMPRIEDLPIPAQNEIRAQRGEAPPAETPDKRRMSLLQRLASVGLGRRRRMLPRRHVLPCSPHLRSSRARLRVRTKRKATIPPQPTASGRSNPSISTAGRRLCITLRRRISWKFPPSCGGKPTDEATGARPPGARLRRAPALVKPLRSRNIFSVAGAAAASCRLRSPYQGDPERCRLKNRQEYGGLRVTFGKKP
jgi:cell division protein FtsZ